MMRVRALKTFIDFTVEESNSIRLKNEEFTTNKQRFEFLNNLHSFDLLEEIHAGKTEDEEVIEDE